MCTSINFEAWLTNESEVVPGSIRTGHNVFTNYGRQWLRDFVSWSLIGGIGDVARDERRFRWIAVGGGSQLEQVGVVKLVSPLTISTGPDVYLRALPAPVYPTPFSVKYIVAFTGAGTDLDHHGASIDISEAALFVDVDDGSGPGLSVADGSHEPVAYKSFTPLTKLQAQTLTITWEFRI